ncbi:MAG TPA: hypothetical protein VHM92_07400 [Allosphingosinicella sp.]|nr:hypothetical protein [Allosphingosinicella sp.]
MSDPASLLTLSASGLVAVGIAAAAGLKAWNGWLDLKRTEIAAGRSSHPPTPAAARIELATLKERVRRLEAIATGSDL